MTANLPVSYQPRDLGELIGFCERICRTGMVPQGYRNKPDDALVAICWGKEVADLPPLTSLNYVAVINGRPGFFGDAVPGIALAKGFITDIDELWDGHPGSDEWTCTVIVTKPNGKKLERSFSVADARRAGLWDKAGPWKNYPQRMLRWRATGYAVRDAAPHALFGYTKEELEEIPAQPFVGPDTAKDITPEAPRVSVVPEPEPAPSGQSFDLFTEAGTWHGKRPNMRLALAAYGEMKKGANVHGAFALANLGLLRDAYEVATGEELRERLATEIAAAEAYSAAGNGKAATPASETALDESLDDHLLDDAA